MGRYVENYCHFNVISGKLYQQAFDVMREVSICLCLGSVDIGYTVYRVGAALNIFRGCNSNFKHRRINTMSIAQHSRVAKTAKTSWALFIYSPFASRKDSLIVANSVGKRKLLGFWSHCWDMASYLRNRLKRQERCGILPRMCAEWCLVAVTAFGHERSTITL